MKHTGKKILSMLLCVALLLSAAACGSSSAQAQTLGSDQVEADVQEYITSFVDPSATVTSLYQSQNNISETQTEVSCQVTYTSDSGDGSGLVTLLYDFTGSEWTLSNCTAELGAASETAPEAVPEAAPEPASEGAPEEAPDAAPETAPETEPETAPAEQSAAPATTPAPATGSGTASGAPTGALAGYTLTEVSTFENPSVGSLRSSRGLIVLEGNETITVYGPNGAAGEYSGYQDLGNSELGFAIVNEETGSVLGNCRGLINGKGEVVLPCEAVWIANINGSRRFVDVFYSTGECTESDDYILCLEDGGLFGSGEKTYYTGYRKIFDLQTNSFVGDIQVTSTDRYAIMANETMVVVDEDDTSTLYDASGNVITQTTAGINLSETLASFRMDGCTYVFDENGERFTTADTIYPVNGDGDYFDFLKDSVYSLVDSDGNAVLPGMTFANVTNCYNNVFYVKNADETAYQLIDVNGNILFESTDYISNVSETVPGWWNCSPNIGTETLISTYTTVEGIDNSYSMTPYDSEGNYTVLNTGETLALGSSASRLTYGMVYARDSSGKYTIYDLFTGTALSDGKYTQVLYGTGYVYALDGSTWHVFQVENIYK